MRKIDRCIAFLRYPPSMVGPQSRRRQCSFLAWSKSGLCTMHANVIVGEITPKYRRMGIGATVEGKRREVLL